MIEKIIRVLKNDPNYRWEHRYGAKDLFIISSERGMQILRGAIEKLFLKSSSGLVFKGAKVKIKHANHMVVGKNTILYDHVYINALSHDGIVMGNNVSIGRDSMLVCTGVIANKGVGITIGNNVGINSSVYLGGQGGITIGDDTIVGPGVKVFSENHNFSDHLKPIRKQGEERKAVKIGENCWIGAGVTILAGVELGNGNVIAAGSVVTKSFGDDQIIAGIPAKVLKKRF